MNVELDNRMTINGGSNGPDWLAEEETTDKRDELIAQLERSTLVLQTRVDTQAKHIRDFLAALDGGYFGQAATELHDSAFIAGLRSVTNNLWAAVPR